MVNHKRKAEASNLTHIKNVEKSKKSKYNDDNTNLDDEDDVKFTLTSPKQVRPHIKTSLLNVQTPEQKKKVKSPVSIHIYS